MTAITLKNISYRYARSAKDTLKNVNITFEAGKIYGIIGKSGAGKSTLLTLIAGLSSPATGEIFYEKTNLKKLDLDRYRAGSIGIVFQSYNLIFNHTAMENILLAMEIGRSTITDKKSYAVGLLQKVGITQVEANRKVLKLSGGQQQRVGIARALANQPNVILADEPTGNLDSETQQEILTIFKELAHTEGKCVIIVTHNQEVADACDELWEMKDGSLSRF